MNRKDVKYKFCLLIYGLRCSKDEFAKWSNVYDGHVTHEVLEEHTILGTCISGRRVGRRVDTLTSATSPAWHAFMQLR